jgi:hypothetical protein
MNSPDDLVQARVSGWEAGETTDTFTLQVTVPRDSAKAKSLWSGMKVYREGARLNVYITGQTMFGGDPPP